MGFPRRGAEHSIGGPDPVEFKVIDAPLLSVVANTDFRERVANRFPTCVGISSRRVARPGNLGQQRSQDNSRADPPRTVD